MIGTGGDDDVNMVLSTTEPLFSLYLYTHLTLHNLLEDTSQALATATFYTKTLNTHHIKLLT